jgi:acyl-CoA thioesterase
MSFRSKSEIEEASGNMENFKKWINENDRFGKYNNMQVVEVRPGYAVAELMITEDSFNGLGVVQGGAVFALADLAFAAAANADGKATVAMNGTMSYIRPGSGKCLRAEASLINDGKRTVVYDVNVYNDKKKLVAHGTITGFHVDDPVKNKSLTSN